MVVLERVLLLDVVSSESSILTSSLFKSKVLESVEGGGVVDSDILLMLDCIDDVEFGKGCCLLKLVLRLFVLLLLFTLVIGGVGLENIDLILGL